MALVTLYMSDRDPQKRTFTDKKEADAHDKKLELAENIQCFIENNLEDLSETQCEKLAMLIAENKERFLTALKGKPEVLSETDAEPDDVDNGKESSAENVTKIAG
ncbi:MAG: YebG family protein [Pseudomonadales bacterium]|nr:YebG family protein [Pseudomonadales bacterium]